MKISTKGRYAVRMMIDLAAYDQGTPLKVKEIAKRQDISEKYLEQIIADLNRAGLVKSIRGAKGGYQLALEPKDCTAGMILRAVEGNLSPVDCVGEKPGNCENSTACASMRLWEKLYEAINGVLEHTTLADLLEWHNELQTDQYII